MLWGEAWTASRGTSLKQQVVVISGSSSSRSNSRLGLLVVATVGSSNSR